MTMIKLSHDKFVCTVIGCDRKKKQIYTISNDGGAQLVLIMKTIARKKTVES